MFNIMDIKLNRILRGHTLKVMETNRNKDLTKNNTSRENDEKILQESHKEKLKNKYEIFASYLAGLTEGDGAIYLPKKNFFKCLYGSYFVT